jgi:cytidyltransferase-like protein
MEYLQKKFNRPGYRVAVFGGSFDPPTLGHLNVIEQVMPKVDEIVLIPSIAHAFGKKLSDLFVRLKMLELFIQDVLQKHPQFKNKIQVLNIEPELMHLHATGYVYTYDVLQKIEQIYSNKNSHKNIEISFVIGPDLASPEIFNRFYKANEIANKWPIIVVEQLRPTRSTYVRNYIAENALKVSSEHLMVEVEKLVGSRLATEIVTHDYYFPDALSQIKIKLDLAIFSIQNNELCILVNKQQTEELPYALIDTQEDIKLEDALNRSILTKLGHLPGYYEQVITQGNRKNNTQEWWLNITYFCLTATTQLSNPMSCWLGVTDFLTEAIFEDQKNSLILCVERLKNKASYTSIPCYLSVEPFTLSELQKIYEIVLGYKLEKKSFRRRFLESGLLEDTGQIRKANHRPAQLYRLVRDKSHVPYYFTRMIEGSRS